MPTRADLARIHIAKKELGLDDATYREVLWRRYRKESAAYLTPSEAADLIELFQQKGWRPVSIAQLGLIHVLWRKLGTAAVLEHADEGALAGFVVHATGKRDLRRLTVSEASRVIEMLKKWLERIEGSGTRH